MSTIEKLIEERKLPELLKFTDGRDVTAENWEERRKELVKQIKKMGEDAKVQLRNQRRDAMDVLKKMKTAKELSEDEVASCEAEVEKTVSQNMSKLENIIAAKEKDLMSI